MNKGTLKIVCGLIGAFLLGSQVGREVNGIHIEFYRFIISGFFMIFFTYYGIKEIKDE